MVSQGMQIMPAVHGVDAVQKDLGREVKNQVCISGLTGDVLSKVSASTSVDETHAILTSFAHQVVDLAMGMQARAKAGVGSGLDWNDLDDAAFAEGLRKILRREPSLLEVTVLQKAVASAGNEGAAEGKCVRTDGAPERIWLQLHGDGTPDGSAVDYTQDVSWCWHQVHDHDVAYVLDESKRRPSLDVLMKVKTRAARFFSGEDESTRQAGRALIEIESLVTQAMLEQGAGYEEALKPALETLEEMAYRLKLVPRGEVVPVQLLEVVRDQFIAALGCHGAGVSRRMADGAIWHGECAGKRAEVQPAGPVSQWVNCSERLPEKYVDLLIKREDGTQRVGRLNKANAWELAAYKASENKYQYMASDVVAWLEVMDGAGVSEAGEKAAHEERA